MKLFYNNINQTVPDASDYFFQEYIHIHKLVVANFA